MIGVIVKNEIRAALRNRSAVVLAVIFYILVFSALASGYKNYLTGTAQRKQAKQMFRKEWVEQHANPHSAAHFGTYLFKPLGLLSLFDTGLNNYTGNSYRVEAHHQTEVNYAAAQDGDGAMRFGELSFAMLFQLFLPLLIIFFCFKSVAAERENHTLKLLLAQGLKPVKLLWGKILGNYLMVTLIIAPVLVLLTVLVWWQAPSLLVRLSLWELAYLIYAFLLSGVFVLISALCGSAKTSLLASLGVWTCFFIILPKIVASTATALYPLPSRGEFTKMVEVANAKGLAGDKDRKGRHEAYLKRTLKKYGVDSVNQLPVNFDGLNMQYGEDYLSKVYLKFNAEVRQNINRQLKLYQWAGFVNPYLSVQQLSMGLAGTDYAHHIDFHGKAQRYRDHFIRKLNVKMAFGDANYLKYDYEVGPEFFKQMKDFDYTQPSLNWVFAELGLAPLVMLFWLLLLFLLVNMVAKRMALN